MASFDNRQPFPAVPPPAGSQETREFYGISNDLRATSNQAPYLTPYLGLRARLSQVWINRWTVLLLLVLVRVLLAIASTDNGLGSARREALSACTSVEQVGSAMASMPHYMSTGVNKMTAIGITRAVNGLESMVTLTITGVEELIVFWIGMLTNTYLCLTTFAVTGSLRVVIDGLEAAQKELTIMTNAIGDDLSSVGSTLQKNLNSFVSGLNTFTGANTPTIDFTKQINELKDLKLPINMTDDLNKLNNSLPTFEQVKNVTDGVIRLPFEELKKLINASMGKYQFNDTLFPVPQKEALTFCSDDNGINNFFDNLVHIEQVAKKVFLATLIIAAILVCFPMAWWEMNRFHRLQERSRLIGSQATDPMDAVYMASRPTTSRGGLFLSKRFSSQRRQILVRWMVSYMTSPAALFILSLGLAGLFSCFCQWILLRAIEKEVPALTSQVANFSGMVVKKLDNASMVWADGTNQVIQSESQRLNLELLGWVNTSTVAVNDTLNKFVDETMNVLNMTFGGTPLYTPVKEVFNCLIGIKIAGIEKGLTWVHDNAHIAFPLLDNQTFSLTGAAQKSNDPSAQDFLTDPSSGAADEISNAVARVTNGFAKAIRQEAIISIMILVVWLVVCFSGLITALIRFRGRQKVRAEAGHDYDAPSNNELRNLPSRDSAAPPPSYVPNPDVSSYAPYALNPHPLPRRNEEDDIQHEKRDSSTSGWPIGNSQMPRREPTTNYTNEKGGFI